MAGSATGNNQQAIHICSIKHTERCRNMTTVNRIKTAAQNADGQENAGQLVHIVAPGDDAPHGEAQAENEHGQHQLLAQVLLLGLHVLVGLVAGEVRGEALEVAAHVGAQGVLVRRPSIPRQVLQYREPVDPDEVLDKAGVTLQGLYKVFQEVMKRREDLRDPVRAGFGKIEKQQIDTKEAILFVERYIMNRRRCTFRSLLMLREGRMYTVVTFLTILELMKLGRIYVTQNDNFGEINIEANDPSQWNDDGMDFMSEWSEDSDLPEREEKPDGTAEN